MHKNLPKFNDESHAHFVTTRTHRNRPYFSQDAFARILLGQIRFYRDKHGFDLVGYVIMPDHMHLLLWWDAEHHPDLTVSKTMQCIKGSSARRIIDSARGQGLEDALQSEREYAHGGRLEHPLQPVTGKRVQGVVRNRASSEQMLRATQECVEPQSHVRNLRYRVWQRGFYDFNVYASAKLLEKLDYMHANPVRAGLVESPADYAWSSYGAYFGEADG